MAARSRLQLTNKVAVHLTSTLPLEFLLATGDEGSSDPTPLEPKLIADDDRDMVLSCRSESSFSWNNCKLDVPFWSS
jgi:hypothetical protein